MFAFAVATPLLLARGPCAAAAPRRPRAALGGADAGSGAGGDDVELTGRRGAGRAYRGDELLFEVRVISPPPRLLGRFNLHPRTQCGDIIELRRAGDGAGEGGGEGEGGAGTDAYVVKRVRNRFVWGPQAGGTAGPKMSRKTLEIKSLARKSVESYLERTLRES